MSYKIQYPPLRQECQNKKIQIRMPMLTTLCFFLFYVIVNTQWQEGAELLHAGVTGLKAAFADISLAAEVFLEDTSLKEALSDAFSILVA